MSEAWRSMLEWLIAQIKESESWIWIFFYGTLVRLLVGLKRKHLPPLRQFLADIIFGGIAATIGWFAAKEQGLSTFWTLMLVTSAGVLGYSFIDKTQSILLKRVLNMLRFSLSQNEEEEEKKHD